jgi:heat shock protein HslJ
VTGKTWNAGLLVFVLGAALALSGCAAPAATGTDVEGTNWKLVTLDGAAVTRAATLSFKEGKITGNSGCNSFGGSYRMDGNILTITEPLASTLMACEEDVMKLEQQYLGALQAKPTVARSGNQLTVTASDGTSLVFTLSQ